jgi:hypothetical protein
MWWSFELGAFPDALAKRMNDRVSTALMPADTM